MICCERNVMASKHELVKEVEVLVRVDGEEFISSTYKNVYVTVEEAKGFERTYPNLGGPPDIRSNGCWRLRLSMWRGSPEYDDFIADGPSPYQMSLFDD